MIESGMTRPFTGVLNETRRSVGLVWDSFVSESNSPFISHVTKTTHIRSHSALREQELLVHFKLRDLLLERSDLQFVFAFCSFYA